MPTTQNPTLVEVAAQIAATLDGPIAYDEFVQRILAIRPSRGKNPTSQTKSALRYELVRIGLTHVDSTHKRVAPIRFVLNGLTIRHVFDAQEISMRRMILRDDEMLVVQKPQTFGFHAIAKNLRLVDAAGREVQTKLDLVKETREGIFGAYTSETPTLHMPRWLAQHSVRAGDSALLTILDYDAMQWQIVHEPAAQRREAEIKVANRVLADLLFEQLDSAQSESVALVETLLIAFAQLSSAQRVYPGDPWTQVIERDRRMRHDGFQLTYIERRSPWESMLSDLQAELAPEPTSPKSLAPAQENTVYRFKIHPTHSKKLWRRIEVLGGQTLRELNNFLVGEFKHDWDHMGGFWRLIPRGAGKRVREVELATISPYPDETDIGADLRMAELNLEPGSRLRWVYDFGAHYEYDLLIEDVEDAPAATVVADYPRVVAQNQPHYDYCTTCMEQGRQTVATHYCVNCSDRKQQLVALCADCLQAHDEEHYTEEIVY